MTQPRRILWSGVLAIAVLLLPHRVAAQSATVTDDAFLSSNANTQKLNLGGQGISLIVAGSSATVGSVQVGTTTAYIKFQLASSLPANVAAANVAKATLKLYLSPLTGPSGAIDIYPVTSGWSESTLSSSSTPTIAATPFASGINVGSANSFLVLDVTQLVQEWLEGPTNGGIVNDGIALVAHTSSSYVVFDSKESIVTSHEPRLEIVLANSGPQGPAGSQGPQGPQGPQGTTGAVGPAGTAATIKVEPAMVVQAGTPPSVMNGGSPSAADLTFILPQGAVGPQGPAGPVLPDLVYTDKDNKFMSNQTLQGNLALAPTGLATPAQGYASNPLDLAASVSDGTNTHNETFRWQSVPLNNGAANFGAQLSLLYGGGTTPTPTGFSANPDGSLNFVSNQVFTGNHVGDGSGLTNLPNTFIAAGDLTGGTTSQTVSRLQGVPLAITGTGTLAPGSVLSYNGGSWIPSPGFSPGGDLSGTATAQTVSKLQGMPLSLTGTGAGSVLAFSGGSWVPTPGFQAGGDLAGTATAQTVNKLQGIPLLFGGTGGPAVGQVLGYNGAGWAATTIPAGPAGPTGPQGPPGPMPTGAAITTTANTFTTSQTINGNLILSGAGAAIQFADGTLQTTAATGGVQAGSVCPNGESIVGFNKDGSIICGQPVFAPAGLTNSQVAFQLGRTTFGATSIAVGSDGFPIVAFQETDSSANTSVMFVHCGNFSCTSGNTTTTLTPAQAVFPDIIGSSLSLTVGSDGLPVLSVDSFIQSQSQIKVFHCADLLCKSLNGGYFFSGGGPTSITIASDGSPIVSYADPITGNLNLAFCNSTPPLQCSTRVNANVTAVGNSLTLRKFNNFPVASVSGGFLFCTDTSCDTFSSLASQVFNGVPTIERGRSSLISEPDGSLIVTYAEGGNAVFSGVVASFCNPLVSCGNSTNIPRKTVIDSSTVNSSSIFLGADGLPIIAYATSLPAGSTSANISVSFVHCGSADCASGNQTSTIQTAVGFMGGGSFGGVSLALGADGQPVMSYSAPNSVVVAHCTDATCSMPTIVRR